MGTYPIVSGSGKPGGYGYIRVSRALRVSCVFILSGVDRDRGITMATFFVLSVVLVLFCIFCHPDIDTLCMFSDLFRSASPPTFPGLLLESKFPRVVMVSSYCFLCTVLPTGSEMKALREHRMYDQIGRPLSRQTHHPL